MTLLLGLDLIASRRGDGLHPALRALLEDRAARAQAGVVELEERRGDRMRQAGPNPAGGSGILRLGNVVRLDEAAATTAARPQTNTQAKGNR